MGEIITGNGEGVDRSGTGIARDQVIEEVCQRVIAGESIAGVFASDPEGFPSYRTFWRWVAADESLQKRVADAELAGCAALADRIIAVSRESRIGEIVTYSAKDGRSVKTVDMVERSKLEVHALQWVLARRMPKKYGDRTVLAGDADAPLHVTDESRSAILGTLGRIAAKLGADGTDREPDK